MWTGWNGAGQRPLRNRELDYRMVAMVLLSFETVVKGESVVGNVTTGSVC